MKLNGKKVQGSNIELIVIPRGGDEPDVVLQATAVLDYAPFNTMCPEPKPPGKVVKGGAKEYNLEDPGYKEAVALYHQRKTSWMILQSLKATPGLEWETVKEGEFRTWTNYEQELKDSGFSHVEIQRIVIGVLNANCLNEARIEEARANFLRGQQALSENSSGPPTDQPST